MVDCTISVPSTKMTLTLLTIHVTRRVGTKSYDKDVMEGMKISDSSLANPRIVMLH